VAAEVGQTAASIGAQFISSSISGDVHLTLVLSRAGSSVDELCELLELRAEKINNELSGFFQWTSVSEFLEKFNALHGKHIKALRDGNAILAHEILGAIHQISYELSRNEFWENEKRSFHRMVYCFSSNAFQDGPLVRIYTGNCQRHRLHSKFYCYPPIRISDHRSTIYNYVALTSGLLTGEIEGRPFDAARIVANLGDTDEYRRYRAAAALANTECDAAVALSEALKKLSRSNQRRAFLALSELGMSTMPILVTALDSNDYDFRLMAALAIANVGAGIANAKHLSVLFRAVDHPNEDIRQQVLVAIVNVKPTTPKAVPALVAALSNEMQGVRAKAAAALGRVRPAGPEQATSLSKALSDPVLSVRQNAAAALKQIGRASASVLASLAAAVADSDETVRMDAIAAIVNNAPADMVVAPALLAALSDSVVNVRIAAITALAKIVSVPFEAVPALIVAVEDHDEKVRAAAIVALKIFGEKAADAVPALSVALSYPHSSIIRRCAALTLASIGPAAAVAVPSLIGAKWDPEPSVRNAAVVALAAIGPTGAEAIPALKAALEDRNPDIRKKAQDALTKIASWPR
jgi:HEAT repeat protein